MKAMVVLQGKINGLAGRSDCRLFVSYLRVLGNVVGTANTARIVSDSFFVFAMGGDRQACLSKYLLKDIRFFHQ